MNELYELCEQCESIEIKYSKMCDDDKNELCECVNSIVDHYKNYINCTATWYQIVFDITYCIKNLRYNHILKLVNNVLIIEVK